MALSRDRCCQAPPWTTWPAAVCNCEMQLGKTESLSHDARRLGVASWTHRAARSQCSQVLSLATPPRQARSCSFPSSASRSVSWSRVPSSTAPSGRTSFQREAKRIITYQKVSSQVFSLGGWAMGAAETVVLRNLHRCSTCRRAVSHHGHRKKAQGTGGNRRPQQARQLL